MQDKTNTIFGIYPIKEALTSQVVFDKVFVQKGIDSDKIESLVKDLEKANVSVSIVPFEKLNRLTRGNHQGIVALTSPVAFHSLESVVAKALESDKPPLFLVLDQITDVRNFGAILRTAECTGVDAVIIQKSGGAPVSGDTVKTSAGAIFKIPICKVEHIKDAIFYLQGSGIITIAATEKTQTEIYSLDLARPVAIIMGSEGKGVSKSVLGLVDERASLPLLGEINSLNVSVACGAFLYEITRQRRL
ncbi:23S rRNA (guanosine(2251)-2'-O)-methyltransferase RlmB [Aequorivita lipolytica]|uniref:23S rRNA (Guanosine(2251)-2'-O)-methyltransferase RlmB n=1 Tax=Aequorivita lipolytica TaxID=153267 RepID=A0A5C6YTV6_9FLAO|nr:23S rRNA (guanosine(2251)-2'-O)-methyltransferase RlmB [Aequorivita lipolytica]TXD70898.1 23S rRNA (guanosine(2251)-2'-O)-methyltransferase RlmB [Aequorivita lipolytica]SRX49952.1 Putative TrmH family tRNA/rRNA methyltransferase [Aequorivita lipolytica]